MRDTIKLALATPVGRVSGFLIFFREEMKMKPKYPQLRVSSISLE